MVTAGRTPVAADLASQGEEITVAPGVDEIERRNCHCGGPRCADCGGCLNMEVGCAWCGGPVCGVSDAEQLATLDAIEARRARMRRRQGRP